MSRLTHTIPARLLVAATALAMLAGCTTSVGTRDNGEMALPWQEARRFAEALEVLRTEFVQPVDDARLIDGAIRGMAEDLDPYSTYLTEQEYAQARIDAAGHYEGIGIEVVPAEPGYLVVNVFEGGPAASAGIRPGDLLLQVDGAPLAGVSPAAFDRLLHGPAETPVALTVQRDGTASFDVRLRRARIGIPSVNVTRLDGGALHARVVHFSDETVADLTRELGGRNISRGIVLDLRNNAGGVVDSAVAFADAFIDAGLIVSTQGRAAGQTRDYEAEPGTRFPRVPMVVLVNGATASAAEIVAGALQDHGAGLLLGTPTFGKGAVQSLIPLDGGGALKITTAAYRTPSGREIGPDGITPDILAPEADDLVADGQVDALMERAAEVLDAMQRNEASEQ